MRAASPRIRKYRENDRSKKKINDGRDDDDDDNR